MSSSAPVGKDTGTTNAIPGRDNSPCRIITSYSLSTAVYYRPVPQATQVHTFIVTDGPTPAGPARGVETPPPSILQKRNPWPDGPHDDSSVDANKAKARAASPASFPWKDVFAVQHITTVGNCPTPTTSPPLLSLPTATGHPTSDHDLNAAHKVNIHLAILVGGLTVGIIVITILIAVAGCIICTRRRKRNAHLGNQLSDVDDTLTCQSNNTAGSSRTTMTERRLKCHTGWQMQEFMHHGVNSLYSSSAISPSSCDKVEILARSGTLSDPFQDRARHWGSPVHPVVHGHHSESLSDTCSTDAPSYFPGDDIRYTMPQGSTTALTEVSCAATIDSNSNSVCPTRLNHLTSEPSDINTSPTITANLNSLIKHKAFVSSMTSGNSLQSIHSDHLNLPHLSPPGPVLTSKSRPHSSQSFSDSIYSDSTHESMYWINRPKS
ncbi:hypothetical protein Pst134EA_030580 [Puccinia striiformis f. sp. tritici]|uniref:hypothetical protein n=1 Tax=Puccinia striiformis f. sp. tritici TaxID=168172 RepID=UPI0020088A05|nr:hypothetical protein Pst134EA_030580 [Puccinia striiformis f. sp. tritici]KAH9446670.1 hypothetical protein Pst134EA_030580 [Puccinia striiformis f. sp. tritici]KAI9600630.1 hypothetical protein H4Q26_000419 [Puccinia striiformis f. sp. tritici PST-130]